MKRLFIWASLFTVLAANAGEVGLPLTFTGMSDASAAVALDADVFVAASDENNILRCYRQSQPGKPVFTYDLNPLFVTGHKKKKPEADLEGAARLGQRIFWIGSHGRNAAGEAAPNRQRLFALEFGGTGTNITVKPVGRVYTNLIANLAADPKLAPFHFEEAAALPPKAPGGLSIEALAATPEGALLIGFRSPVPGGRALLVPLTNPNELMDGQPPKFGDPILLNLGGLGLRDMEWTGHGYYLIGGSSGEQHEAARLFFWPGGTAAPQPIEEVKFKGLTPEGICFQDIAGQTSFLVLSDDGNRKVDGEKQKELPEAQQQFRAVRIQP